MKRAQQELGDEVLAVVVASETFREQEFQAAVQFAENMGVRVYITQIHELDNPDFVANTPESWYHCKKMLYSHLHALAEELGYPYVIDGMVMDDLSDFRPGLKARDEFGIRSPLQEANLYKKEVRAMAKELNLSVWNKLPSCNLSSRIPYGTTIDLVKIQQVNEAELFLANFCEGMVRVRHHGKVARIEVTLEDIQTVLEHRDAIYEKLGALGFTYVSLDLRGYRMGSMNETISDGSDVKRAVNM